MAKKFIPDADSAFAIMARNFADRVASDPERYHIPPADAQAIQAAVAAFRSALAANYSRATKCQATVARKDQARAEAERLIRRAGHLIRNNRDISAADKIVVGVKDRPARLRRQKCPQTPPQLMLAAAAARTFGTPGIHVLKFFDPTVTGTTAKPAGATRLELFVDLIPPGERIPAYPGQLSGGRNWYLGSFTRSPIRVEYPKSETPMQVVYWGRWANATGETGKFSRTLVAPIEGLDWSRFALPAPPDDAADGRALEGLIGQTVIITSARRELPDRVETIDTLRAESGRERPALPEKIADAA